MSEPRGGEQSVSVEDLDPVLQRRLASVIEEGREIWHRFDEDVRRQAFHPFVPADYDRVLPTLVRLHAPGARFLEWGSATGVIAIMADMLGFEAYGIELDRELVAVARDLARRHGSGARFAVGSFLPGGYRYRPRHGDDRLGTIGRGPSGYGELGHPLDDFDVVYAYPWSGEEPIMRDVMRAYGAPHARLILHDVEGDASSPPSAD
jgi:hypothetical protein